MAQWLRLQLGGGTVEGKRLIAPTTVAEMQSGQIVPRGGTDPLFKFSEYGLGWGVQEYRGQKIVQHSGAIDGMQSLVAMIPEQKLGVVVLTNGLRTKLAAAVERSGPDFALHSWIGPTPERWLDDVAVLWTRMSTDAPDAGLGTPEDVWTAERLATEDARKERDDPRKLVTTAAEHLPTGRLVAYSEYSVPPQADRAAQQYGTLVLKEFRGHGLGMLVKLGNLEYLPRVSPGHPSALTFNAEENRPMLDVNEAMGFVGIAYEGIWRKDL
jgi:GNAT superfamily N-acetyltransferase